jgi:adenosylhomocysteinase
MKDGAIVCNSGHFDVEINLRALEKLATKKRENVRPFLDEYTVRGKRLYVIGQGRLVNLVAAEGHPPSVMDMSFSTQALAATWVARNKDELEPRVYEIDPDIEEMVARLKLASMEVSIDTLTEEQRKYLSSWTEGT